VIDCKRLGFGVRKNICIKTIFILKTSIKNKYLKIDPRELFTKDVPKSNKFQKQQKNKNPQKRKTLTSLKNNGKRHKKQKF
jgi:hypothetical protein